jgi:hypothetical protein
MLLAHGAWGICPLELSLVVGSLAFGWRYWGSALRAVFREFWRNG